MSADWTMVIVTTIYMFITILILLVNRRQLKISIDIQRQNMGIQLYEKRIKVINHLFDEDNRESRLGLYLLFSEDIANEFAEYSNQVSSYAILEHDEEYYKKTLKETVSEEEFEKYEHELKEHFSEKKGPIPEAWNKYTFKKYDKDKLKEFNMIDITDRQIRTLSKIAGLRMKISVMTDDEIRNSIQIESITKAKKKSKEPWEIQTKRKKHMKIGG